jgi:formylglycine-generating enzyme required for sulfatase activity
LSGPDVLWPKKFACDGWRLPTESEWEFFARAGTQADFATPSGEGALPASLEERDLCSALELSDGTKISDMGWFCGNSDKKIHPVKEKSSNKLGLYDTIGNVWEWTWDWYAPYPDGILDDPVGPFMTSHLCSKDKPGKVSRGGSFSNDIATIRPSFRYCAEPDSSSKSIGFRLVRTAMD